MSILQFYKIKMKKKKPQTETHVLLCCGHKSNIFIKDVWFRFLGIRLKKAKSSYSFHGGILQQNSYRQVNFQYRQSFFKVNVKLLANY